MQIYYLLMIIIFMEMVNFINFHHEREGLFPGFVEITRILTSTIYTNATQLLNVGLRLRYTQPTYFELGIWYIRRIIQ